MERKEITTGPEVNVKGEEAPESCQAEGRSENPSQSNGSITAAVEAVAAAAPINVAVTGTEVKKKKKRGRPRKYGSEGKVTPALSPMPISASIPLTVGFSAWAHGGWPPADAFKKKHKLEFEKPGEGGVAYSVGANFTPHVITVDAGKDIMMKIMSLSQQESRAICILAANGAISNVTLHQPNSSGGTLTYEGHFEILSLSGSFMPTDNGVTKSRSGGMSISLAGPDGHVVGGGLAGLLVAAGPVQVVVGSFLPGHQLEQKPRKNIFESTITFTTSPANPFSGGAAEWVFGGSKPNFAYSSSIGEVGMASLKNTSKNLIAENKVSLPGADSIDLTSPKCEVSC